MKDREAKTVHERTWYGVNATVRIGPGFIHRAGWRNFINIPPGFLDFYECFGIVGLYCCSNASFFRIVHELVSGRIGIKQWAAFH